MNAEQPWPVVNATHTGFVVSLDRRGDYKVVPVDAIVIERGDDMTVRLITTDGAMYWKHGDGHDESDYRSADELETDARRLLARAEHLRTRTQVDEAEVERITAALCDAEMDHPDGPVPHVIARRLYLAGVRAPEVTE